MVRRSPAAALAVVLIGPAAATAEDRSGDSPVLARARLEIEAMQYELARETLGEALRLGTSGPRQLSEILLRLGWLAAALGDEEAAEREFRLLLSIDPEAVLPPGTSPKIVEPFEAARRQVVDAGSLRFRAEAIPEASSVVFEVLSDPYDLIAGAAALYRGPEGSQHSVVSRGKARIELEIPGRGGLDVTVAALDHHGNRLAELELHLAAPAARPTLDLARSGAGGERPPSRPLYARWPAWAALSGAALGAGGAFALDGRAARRRLRQIGRDSAEHEFHEAQRLDARGRRSTVLANVAFGASAGFATVAAGLALRDLVAPSRSDRASIAPAPGLGGVVLVVPY